MKNQFERAGASFGALAILITVLNFAFWGGMAYLVLYLLHHFGVI